MTSFGKALLAVWLYVLWVIVWAFLSIFVIGSTHNPVNGSLVPFHKTFPLQKNFTCPVSYVTLHPASISILIDISDVCAKPGTICAALAA